MARTATQLERDLERAYKQRYVTERQQLADQRNEQLKRRLDTLRTMLESALNTMITFNSVVTNVGSLASIPPLPNKPSGPPDKAKFESAIPQAGFLERVTGIGKSARLDKARRIKQEYKQELDTYEKQVAQYKRQIQGRNELIRAFRQLLVEKDASAVIKYCTMVLRQSEYPEGFLDKKTALSYNRETGELILEYDLPTYESIMPTLKGYKYVKARDEIQELSFNKTDERELKTLYEDVIASITLRTLYEIFTADETQAVASIVFNGMVNTIDKATGKDIRPCLVSVQASREEFARLDLSRVDKKACLKHLKAQTSPSYQELVPVKPIVQLVKTDPRFIKEVDMLSELDSRPNLLEMDPFAFEHLISNLFSKIGLKTSTTRASRDGGIDVIAFDERPIFSGKVVIQAKRYRNTVEVSAVRDLYGSMINEGATKGILVTTSSYGIESRNFAKDKPIELIDGNGLLYLLEQHGYGAKIEIPK